MIDTDVIVIAGGAAGLCAAISAVQAGAKVPLLKKSAILAAPPIAAWIRSVSRADIRVNGNFGQRATKRSAMCLSRPETAWDLPSIPGGSPASRLRFP